MCRNHSHLLAELLGEDTNGFEPCLVYALRHKEVLIEASYGSKLLIPTSGLLFVPSWSMAGLSPSEFPEVGGPRLSLSFMTVPEQILKPTTTPASRTF